MTTVKENFPFEANVFSLNYKTKVENFQIASDNRGMESTKKNEFIFPEGIDPTRVMTIYENVWLEKKWGFLWDLGLIKTILLPSGKLWVLDGSHRVALVMYLIHKGELPENYEIPFTQIRGTDLENATDIERYEFMNQINKLSSTWTQDDIFKCARKNNLKSMLAFDTIDTILKGYADQLKYVNNDRNVNAMNVLKKANVKYSFVKSLKKVPTGQKGKITFNMLYDETIYEIGTSKEFINEYIELIKFVIDYAILWHKERGIRISKTIDALLSIINSDGLTTTIKNINKALKNVREMPKTEHGIKTFILGNL